VLSSLQAQEMRVERVKVVDQSTPIFNIYVDDNNKKWVSNTKGDVYLLHAVDLADKVNKVASKQYLFDLPGGNADISWPKSAMENIIGNGVEIISSFYDPVKKDLWIGTIDDGAYRIKVEPSLKMVERINTGNSKLKSNRINVIYKDYKKRIWLGTQEGAYIGIDDKWKLIEKYINFEAIAGYGNSIWAMGDESVWEMDDRDNSLLLDIDIRRDIEGPMRDIALDHDGHLWIASNVMTRYNIETEKYTVFGPGQYITSQFVNCIAVDDDGTLWIGSEDKGMYHIERADNIVVTALVEKGLSCDGLSDDASLIVKITGGEAPFTYQWEQGIEGENPKNLAGGTYRITVTDVDGKSNSTSVEIPDPKMKLSVEVEKEESGIGNKDGVASITIEGGLPEYTIKWDNGEYGKKAKALTGGTHSLVVTDASGCTAKAAFNVGQKTEEIQIAIDIEEKLKCFGESNASILATVSGGRPPYKYIWDGSDEATEKRTNLEAGSYQLTVTDADGKEGLGTINIIEPQKIIVNAKTIKPATANNSDGQAIAKVDGGRAPLKYKWDNGETTAQANKLSPGEHTVEVSDASGCVRSAKVNVSEDIDVISLEVVQTKEISCYGEKTASIKVEISGGKAPFEYTWSDPTFNGDEIDNVGSGRYALTVKDATGTEASYSLSVEEPDEMTAEIKSISAASEGQENGVAEVKVKGVKGKLIYRWDNGESTAKATKLGPGAHSVSIANEAGCKIEVSTEIEADYGEVTAEITKVAEISCPGEKDGHIQIDVNGGKGPFEYKWSDPSVVGGNPSNIGAGKYEVTIVDDLGSSTIAKLDFEDPDPLEGKITVINPASTGASDAKAEVTISGGSGKYYYKWDNGESTAVATKLGPGTRTLLVSDENECTLDLQVEIKEDILDLAVSFEQTKGINCNGDSGGEAILNVSGGKPPYALKWSDNVDGNPAFENGKVVLTALKAGKYNVEVEDVAGGKKTLDIEIDEPSNLTADVAALKSANTDASDGEAEVNVKGGTGKYNYKWSNGETKAKAVNLAAGSHSVTITDEANCSIEASVEITEDILDLAVSFEQAKEINCNGDSGGEAILNVSGGKPPYSLKWSDNVNGNPSIENGKAVLTSLIAGNYRVEVEDGVGGKKSLELEIDEPEGLTASVVAVKSASTGGSDGEAEVNAKGGTGKYNYKWSNGETKAKAVILTEGSHSVTITDEANCKAVGNVTITEDILELTAVLKQTSEIKCVDDKNGALDVVVTGGKGPFTYNWTSLNVNSKSVENLEAGDYTVEVSDAAGNNASASISIKAPAALNALAKVTAMTSVGNENGAAEVTANGGQGKYSYKWDNGSEKAKVEKLGAGNHSVTVTDEAGCSTVASISVLENILDLGASISQTQEIKCNGAKQAAITVDLQGGKGPFQYKWSDASLNGANPQNVGAGSYTVEITDAKSNVTEANIEIKEPAILTANVKVDAPATTGNENGKATVSATGGSGKYSYKWDNGETTATATKLSPGSHKVVVSDANNCQSEVDIEISENVLALQINLKQTKEIKCSGAETGALSIAVDGGKAPYTFAWNDATVSGQNPENLKAGKYEVTVSDASGKSKSANVDITEPKAFSIELRDMRPSAEGGKGDGIATVFLIGGKPTFKYQWDNGETTKSAKTLNIGQHSVSVTDANGCQVVENFEIKKKILPNLTLAKLEKGEPVKMEQLQFEADSTKILPGSIPTLDEVYDFLNDNKEIVVEIGGHTNNLPEDDFCDVLSTARAKEVATYIVQKGIPEDRVYFRGYGKRKPIASNYTKEGRARNQRVEIKILKVQK